MKHNWNKFDHEHIIKNKKLLVFREKNKKYIVAQYRQVNKKNKVPFFAWVTEQHVTYEPNEQDHWMEFKYLVKLTKKTYN